MNDAKYSSIHYSKYLELDRILEAQNLRSEEVGAPAHEEMLFIITHQVYELWFKQINHELYSIRDIMTHDPIHDNALITVEGRLSRVKEILKLAVDQIGIMETMTPLDFLDFRNYLFPASGFQSFQFREMEVLLGLKEEKRTTYNNMKYRSVFTEEQSKRLSGLEKSQSLLELFGAWLERTPFIEMEGYSFIKEYQKAVDDMIRRESEAIQNTSILTDEMKQMRLKMLGDTHSYYSIIFDENRHAELLEEGIVRMSYKATLAVLLINLYRDEPIFQLPFKLLSLLVDIDDQLTTWRYRHAQMVMRMLGRKVGTGGSSGHEYLAKTASKHLIFYDLHNISTLLISRSDRPELPDEVREQLGFYFNS